MGNTTDLLTSAIFCGNLQRNYYDNKEITIRYLFPEGSDPIQVDLNGKFSTQDLFRKNKMAVSRYEPDLQWLHSFLAG